MTHDNFLDFFLSHWETMCVFWLMDEQIRDHLVSRESEGHKQSANLGVLFLKLN